MRKIKICPLPSLSIHKKTFSHKGEGHNLKVKDNPFNLIKFSFIKTLTCLCFSLWTDEKFILSLSTTVMQEPLKQPRKVLAPLEMTVRIMQKHIIVHSK